MSQEIETTSSQPAPAVRSTDGVRARHDGDCTIYGSLINGTPLDGICTCGYGWECVRDGDWSKMFSQEWLEAHERPNG